MLGGLIAPDPPWLQWTSAHANPEHGQSLLSVSPNDRFGPQSVVGDVISMQTTDPNRTGDLARKDTVVAAAIAVDGGSSGDLFSPTTACQIWHSRSPSVPQSGNAIRVISGKSLFLLVPPERLELPTL
jgi:hypothetical protein